MPMRELLLLLHLLAAAVWIGGMATMVFAVRPSLALIEPPAARVRFAAAVLGRLFAAVAVAIVVLFGSGLWLVGGAGGWPAVHGSVAAMAAIALVMSLVFAFICAAPYARLRRALAAGTVPAAAAALGTIRRLVAVNLALGVGVFVVATLGRAA